MSLKRVYARLSTRYGEIRETKIPHFASLHAGYGAFASNRVRVSTVLMNGSSALCGLE
jgi:hypothetical protein